MLPPPPASRRCSYTYTHRVPTGHNRIPSVRSIAQAALGMDPEDDEDDALRAEMSTFEEASAAEEQRQRSLENTLERLGFGAYHWRLLTLCGFGWMSDNSALQCIAVILPRVQIHYNLSSQAVGLLSASTMAGMMIGAVAWGVVSDLLGRALPFNTTLFLTGVFGIGASFSPNFGILCCWLFCLGSAVGGSMPTDGTLFLENLPHSKQYLLTLLSVFFSLGAVLSSVISLIFLPGASCKSHDGCDIENSENDGWRKVLLVLGLFNLACALARWFLFKLQESPRYLVSNGREQEAILALQTIADFNENTIEIQHADVSDHSGKHCSAAEPSPVDANDDLSRGPHGAYGGVGIGPPRTPRNVPFETGLLFNQSPCSHLRDEDVDVFDQSFVAREETSEEHERLINNDFSKDRAITRTEQTRTGGNGNGSGWRSLPKVWWGSWSKQMEKLFVPQWRKTVILMWIIWGSISLAYTMFNVWLPSVLESRASGEGDEAIREALGDYVLYSVAGCPGSIIGAWMIQTRLGRRKSLSICTLATGLSTFAFIRVEEKWALITSSMVISAAATAMYAVLYGMTPESFGTSIRGTACGTSAALSRLTGVISPLLAGFLLAVSPSLPVFTSAAIFCGTAACSMALPFERVGGPGRGTGGAMH